MADVRGGKTLAALPTDVLKRVVEQHIVPRLVVSHPHAVRRPIDTRPVAGRVADLTELALRSEDALSREMLLRLQNAGATHDALQLGLLAPAADCLGRLWREDQIDILDVTIATNSLIRSMRFVSIELDRLPRAADGGAAILLAPAPGETHSFGTAMAAEFFRRGGWQVSYMPAPSEDELVASVAAQPFDVIGLSLTDTNGLAAFTHTISALRKRSRNAGIVVIVGGPAFVADPALVTAAGADAAIAAIDVASVEARHVMRRMSELR
ncbi:MAG: cobalamin B12-binding domain-containing protein [Thermohalobaculum sp.]|nr:cobalamin B12-binding domain-containing protein [Thermohalobaculum sp.]